MFVWYGKPQLKCNIIGFPSLNNFSYHFINLCLNFFLGFFHNFSISSFCFHSHKYYFRFSIHFVFYIIHWGLWNVWINIIPWNRFSCAIIHIDSLWVNHNRIHCCFIAVLRTSQWWKLISSTCNKMSEGQVLFILMPTIDLNTREF